MTDTVKDKPQRKKKELLLNPTYILIIVLVILFVIGIVSLVLVRNAKKLDISSPYSTAELVYGNVIDGDIRTISGVAADLCVTEQDVGNSNITLEGDSVGALLSVDDKSVEFSSSLYEKAYPASITKIMTAILAEKYGNMDDVVTIAWQDLELESGSQVCGFKIGDQVTMNELFHGLLIHSGNDAAMAIARHVGGSMAGFVKMMNEEAQAIGAFDTHFMNPSGLHDDNHYTSVYDIYLMLNEALKYDHFVQVMQLSVYDLTYLGADGTEQSVTLDSTDHYLTKEVSAPKGVTILGGKTGTTSLAGHCLALLSQNAYGKPYISIVLKAGDATSLYTQMNQLLAETNR